MKYGAFYRDLPSEMLNALDSRSNNVLLSWAAGTLEALEKTYSVGLTVYLALERIGIRRRFSVPVPVISIGNLSVGGTGKTPATILIGRALQSLGLSVVVLSRGHGGKASAGTAIVSDEKSNILLTTDDSGDEPMALALDMPGIPVIVGKDRRKSAALALRRFSPDLLLLDDGFQYWQLQRDVDIVLLDGTHPFENGHCLPRGLLREPKENLRRAQIVIVTRSSNISIEKRDLLLGQIASLAPAVHTFFSEHVGSRCYPANDAASEVGEPVQPLAICAIARPKSFMNTLAQSGVHPVGTMLLPDHYRYCKSDEQAIVGKMKESRARTVVTTQKDYVKLKSIIASLPVFVQPIEFEVDHFDELISDLLSRIKMPATLFSYRN